MMGSKAVKLDDETYKRLKALGVSAKAHAALANEGSNPSIR